MSATEIAEANVRQLQCEAKIPKIKVSAAIADLQVSLCAVKVVLAKLHTSNNNQSFE